MLEWNLMRRILSFFFFPFNSILLRKFLEQPKRCFVEQEEFNFYEKTGRNMFDWVIDFTTRAVLFLRLVRANANVNAHRSTRKMRGEKNKINKCTSPEINNERSPPLPSGRAIKFFSEFQSWLKNIGKRGRMAERGFLFLCETLR